MALCPELLQKTSTTAPQGTRYTERGRRSKDKVVRVTERDMKRKRKVATGKDGCHGGVELRPNDKAGTKILLSTFLTFSLTPFSVLYLTMVVLYIFYALKYIFRINYHRVV